jgi:chromosome segregation ATPase
MRLNRIDIAHFGKLNTAFEFAADRCNVLCAENEFGKSTLVDAILFALYPPPPPKKGARSVLKPLERYTPWEKSSGPPQIRLTLALDNGHLYRIEATLDNPLTYRFVDIETNNVISIPSKSFGMHSLGLSLAACLQSFLLRQEDNVTDTDDGPTLRDAIQRATSSALEKDGISANKALDILSGAKFAYEGGAPILISSILKRINDRLDALRSERAGLEEQRQALAGPIAQMEQLRSQAAATEHRVVTLEYQVALARMAEIQQELTEQEKRKHDHAHLLERKAKREPYAKFSAQAYAELQNLWGSLSSHRATLDKLRAAFRREVEEPLSSLRRELETFPPSAERLTPEDETRLGRLVISLQGQAREIEEAAERVRLGEEQLRHDGGDVDHIMSLEDRLQHLEQEEMALLLGGYQTTSVKLRDEQSEAVQERANAQQECAAAEQTMMRLRFWAGGAWFLALLSGAAVVAGLLYHLPPATWAGITAGVITVLAGLVLSARAHHVRENELRSAREHLASADSRVLACRNHVDELDRRYEETRAKANISTVELLALERYGQFSRAAAAIMKERQQRDHLQRAFEENMTLAVAIARAMDPDLPDQPTIEALQGSHRRIQHYLSRTSEIERLQKEEGHRQADIQREEREIATLEEKIRTILDAAGTPGDSMEERIRTYGTNTGYADEYRDVMARLESLKILNPEKEEELLEEQKHLEELLAQMRKAHADLEQAKAPTTSRAQLEASLNRARTELEQTRKEYQAYLRKCEGVIEAYRKRVPELEDEIRRKEELLARLNRSSEAMALARQVIEQVNEKVSHNWQAVLTQRLKEYVPALLDRYEDPGVLPDLGLTLRDRETGRVLQGQKELGYLSKGARDQLSFLLRLAIGDVLTSHLESLPLILDEPFAHWDDERFAQGMRFLTELSSKRQVIVMSCHQWRFDRLREEYPHISNELSFVSTPAEA